MRIFRSLIVVTALVLPLHVTAQTARTQIVMLGTGTPIPDPDRRVRPSRSSWIRSPTCSTRAQVLFGVRPRRDEMA